MTATQSYHKFLCRERAACEGDLACFNDPKVVRNLNGQDRVYCYEHDPEIHQMTDADVSRFYEEHMARQNKDYAD